MGNNLCYSSVTHHSVNTVSSCQSLCHSCITPPGHKPDTLGDCAAAAAAQSCDIVFSPFVKNQLEQCKPSRTRVTGAGRPAARRMQRFHRQLSAFRPAAAAAPSPPASTSVCEARRARRGLPSSRHG